MQSSLLNLDVTPNPITGRIGAPTSTLDGRLIYAFDMRPEEVNYIDIAHSLSRRCRWNCFTNGFYSVGQHTLHGIRLINVTNLDHFNIVIDKDLLRQYFFLHDACEAYLPDVPTPLKPYIVGWKELENKTSRAIYDHFGLPYSTEEMHKAVKLFDRWCLNMEAGTIAFKHEGGSYGDAVPESNALMAPVSIDDAKITDVNERLIQAFHNLFPGTKDE